MATRWKVSVREILFPLSVFCLYCCSNSSSWAIKFHDLWALIQYYQRSFLYSKIQCFPNICLPFSLLSFKSSQAINKNAVSQLSEVSNSFPVDKICLERQIKIQTKSLLLLNSILILELHFFDLFLSSSFNSSTFHPQCLQLTKNFFIIINHCSQMVRWR